MSGHVVQCASCRINVQLVKKNDGAESVRCPGCGKTATKDEAVESAKVYAVDAVTRQLNDQLREIARSCQLLGYRPGKEPLGRHDWILDGI